MKRRRGGTLIELLVALVLLDLALLSLAMVGALTVRRIGDASRRARATLAAANRVEQLSALPCAGVAGDAASLERHVSETWTVQRDGKSVVIADSVEIATGRPERVVVRRRVPC